jgi:serine/threonine-protein kinase
MGVEKDTAARSIGRYVLFREVAHGGMATVHLGRLRGPAGFSRTVAIKRLHPQFARDPEFVSMFLDEARLAARVQHPNVVSVLDVVAAEGELFLVMDYVHGESFARLLTAAQAGGAPVLPRLVTAIATNVLDGLHAAHEARNERGDPLNIVHRDVSPQNVMVGADGVARVLDFGIAKASARANATTRDGQLKGKVPYMAPEQITGDAIDRRTDVYSASVMLWEALTGRRLFPQNDAITIARMVLDREHAPPSTVTPGVPPELDAIVLKGLARDPEHRWATAHEMAAALERAWPTGSAREVGEWVRSVAADPLGARAASIAEIENAELPAPPAKSSGRGRISSLVSAPDDVTVAAIDPATRQGEPVSALTNAATTSETDASHPAAGLPKRRRAVWAGSAAAGAIAVGVVIWAASPRSRPVSAPAAAARVESVESALVAASSPPAETASTPAPEPPPSAMASGTPASSSAAPPRAAASAPSPRRAVPSRPAAGSRPGCSPPYTIDANGVRVPKRQCF